MVTAHAPTSSRIRRALHSKTWRRCGTNRKRQCKFPVPTIDLRRLAILKETKRERDYSFIAEIARLLPDVREQLLWSRSPREIIELAQQHPELMGQLAQKRPLLSYVSQGPDALEEQLDVERRNLKKGRYTAISRLHQSVNSMVGTMAHA